MWEDNNHLYVFGKSLYQQEYKVLQKGFEAGLGKQKISNAFANQAGATCVMGHFFEVDDVTSHELTVDVNPIQKRKEEEKK